MVTEPDLLLAAAWPMQLDPDAHSDIRVSDPLVLIALPREMLDVLKGQLHHVARIDVTLADDV